MEQGVWQEIELLCQKFQKLGISEAVDYDKFLLRWMNFVRFFKRSKKNGNISGTIRIEL